MATDRPVLDLSDFYPAWARKIPASACWFWPCRGGADVPVKFRGRPGPIRVCNACFGRYGLVRYEPPAAAPRRGRRKRDE